MGVVGFEPTSTAATDFESVAVTAWLYTQTSVTGLEPVKRD